MANTTAAGNQAQQPTAATKTAQKTTADTGKPIATKEKTLNQVHQAFGFVTHRAADPSTPNSGVYFQELKYEGEGDAQRITGMDESATSEAYETWKKQNNVQAEEKTGEDVPNPEQPKA